MEDAFSAGTHDDFTRRFRYPTADLHPLCAKGGIAHALGIRAEIVCFDLWDTACGPCFGWDRGKLFDHLHQGECVAFMQQIASRLGPCCLLWMASSKDTAGHLPDMFACMPQVDNVHGLR